MTDKLEERTVRAAQAEALLRSEIVTESIEQLKREYYEAILRLPDDAVLQMQVLKHAALNVERVRAHLVSLVNDGKLAKQRIDELNNRPKIRAV